MQIRSLSTVFSVFLTVLIALSGCTGNGTIQVFFDMETPQHVFAPGDIETALQARDYKVKIQDLSTLDVNQKGNKVVIAMGSDEKATSLMISQGGTEVPEMGEQAYALRTTNKGGKIYWIIGGDTNGAMYGGLQIAENISFNGLKVAYNEDDSPFLKNRGIKFNIPLDKASPTYFYGHHGTAHKLAIKHVFPEVSVDKLFEAWSSASGAIRRANEHVTGKWQFDMDFWPEMWTGDHWKGDSRHFSIEETKEATPFAGSYLCTLYNTAKGECGNKTPAWENIEKIDNLSSNALAILETLPGGSNTELQLTLKDLTAQAYGTIQRL